MREILKDLNRLRDRPFSWIRRHNIVRMLILPNKLVKSMQSQSKPQQAFCDNQVSEFKVRGTP